MRDLKLVAFSILFSIFFGIASIAKADHSLTIYAVNYPPYEIENPDVDNLQGFDVEVVTEAFLRKGYRATVDFRPWKRIVSMAKTGTALAILSCGKAAGREEYIYYSDPISAATRTYVALKDYAGDVPRSIKDATGKKIVVVSGYVSEKELIAEGMEFDPIIDDESALRVLQKRGQDFFFTSREFVEYLAGSLDISNQFQYFDTQKKVDYHLCFSKNWPHTEALRNIFNIGLAEIKADGTYDKIHAKYK